jgi:hypothetical protein
VPRPTGGAAAVDQGLRGLPFVKPPYGVLTAIDLNSGAIKFKVPHGDTPDNVRAALERLGINYPGETGQGGSVGLMVTKTLVMVGDPQVTAPAGRQRGAMLRAYDKQTGKEGRRGVDAAPQSGSPMTYSRQRQAVHRRRGERRQLLGRIHRLMHCPETLDRRRRPTYDDGVASFFFPDRYEPGQRARIHDLPLIGDRLEVHRVLGDFDQHEVIAGVEALGGQVGFLDVAVAQLRCAARREVVDPLLRLDALVEVLVAPRTQRPRRVSGTSARVAPAAESPSRASLLTSTAGDEECDSSSPNRLPSTPSPATAVAAESM